MNEILQWLDEALTSELEYNAIMLKGECLLKAHGLEGAVKAPDAFCPIPYVTGLAAIKRKHTSEMLPSKADVVKAYCCAAFWLSSRQPDPGMAPESDSLWDHLCLGHHIHKSFLLSQLWRSEF